MKTHTTLPGRLSGVFAALFLVACLACPSSAAAADWVTYEPKPGPGQGKHIVLLSGDEEYRSEEALPALGKILSQHHGFKCTVLFPINPADGTIDPNNQTNIPGMQAIDTADLVICLFRFRELPDPDMKHLVDYLQAGKPFIALRTSTHAFQYSRDKTSPYARFSWNSKDWPGGFGQQVLGDTWINHHGNHGKESTRGLIDGLHAQHPILRGVKDVWGPTDVYSVVHLKPTDVILLHGLSLRGMTPEDPPVLQKSLMPLVWMRDYTWENGKVSHTLTSTIGAAPDLLCEDLRRLFINACYHLTGLEVPKHADVSLVGDFKPTFFGFNGYKKGVKPADHELP